MAYEYLTFGGVLVLALLLGTGAGAIHNGSFSNHPETIIVNTETPKTKIKRSVRRFERREPILPPNFDVNSLQKPTKIAEIEGIDYSIDSIAYNYRADLLYPGKNEWFKEIEKKLKQAVDSHLKTDELKSIKKELENVAEPDGSKLRAWCQKSYIEEHRSHEAIAGDVWTYCKE